MRIGFFASEKARERILAEAFCEGAKLHGHDVQIIELPGPEDPVAIDVACMVGVKSIELWAKYRRTGAGLIMFDKGYDRARGAQGRTWEYWRVAVNSHHPTRYLPRMTCPPDRLAAWGIDLVDWQKNESGHFVFAGSSEKYHRWYELEHPTAYADKVIARLRKTGRRVIYRPKPSWHGATAIPGAEFSHQPKERRLDSDLEGAYALVTHGSNACLDALIAGIPQIVLGDGITKSISATSIKPVVELRYASRVEVEQLLSNLAYCQWTLAEFASGEAWATIKDQLFGIVAARSA